MVPFFPPLSWRKRQVWWIFGTEPKPALSDPAFAQWDIDNYTILGWIFNSMEDRIYHMFMFHDTVSSLWTSLTQMYAHECNDSRIFELYRDVAQASQATLGLSVADYFGYLQSRWEELAQYEPLSEFPTDAAKIALRRLNRHHTYQFLMGLKPEFESLRTQILNTSPMPSLFEAFATIDGDERRRRLLQPPALPKPSPVPDQRALAAPSGPFTRPPGSGNRPFCTHCGNLGHIKDRCFKLHLELREKGTRNKGKGPYRTAVVVETAPSPDLLQLQTQMG